MIVLGNGSTFSLLCATRTKTVLFHRSSPSCAWASSIFLLNSFWFISLPEFCIENLFSMHRTDFPSSIGINKLNPALPRPSLMALFCNAAFTSFGLSLHHCVQLCLPTVGGKNNSSCWCFIVSENIKSWPNLAPR